jgi:pimeloyl-ACP methyl ester carboxylesterase
MGRRSHAGTVVTTVHGRPERLRVESATTADEMPVYLPAGPEHVFGVLTRPTGPANGTALLCFHAGAQNLTSHRNRVFTRLCREVAGAGYTAFRMDFHGTGDSSGVLVDRGVSGQTMVDVDVAVRWLTEQGARRIVAVGTCWGGLVALVAATRHPAIVSTCLISPPLYFLETGASVTRGRPQHERLSRALLLALRPHVLRLFLSERGYRRWALARARRRIHLGLGGPFSRRRSPMPTDDHVKVSGQSLLAPLVQRRVPIRVLFGEQDQTYLDQLKLGRLPSLEAASEIIDTVITPVTVHRMPTVRSHETVLQFVRDCLARDAAALHTTSRRERAGLLLDD